LLEVVVIVGDVEVEDVVKTARACRHLAEHEEVEDEAVVGEDEAQELRRSHIRCLQTKFRGTCSTM